MSAEKEVGCQTHSIKGNYNGLEMFKVCHHAQYTTEEHQSLLLRLPGWLQQHCRAERMRDAGDVCGTEIKAGDFLKQCVQTEESLGPVMQSNGMNSMKLAAGMRIASPACLCMYTIYTKQWLLVKAHCLPHRTMSDRPSLKTFSNINR